MSSTSRMILPSTSSTWAATVLSTGSPYVRIVYDIHVRLEAVSCEQYFDDDPTVASDPTIVDVTLPDTAFTMETDRGVFSHGHLDTATSMLLRAPLPLAASGHLLDLGCGAGPIALTMARRSPDATIWAVDVNRRARELCRRNAERNALGNVRVVHPDEVPTDIRFATIWSNPPIRIGKQALHTLLLTWLGRLAPDGTAALVVQKHLGADSLQRWLVDHGHPCERLVSKAGFRLLGVASRDTQ
jgi:16S rRNA (guanine1207-N2)-methyltransferase